MQKLRALVVDDDPINLDVAVAILGGAGHDVTVAHNGAEAVALCVEQGIRFDLVLMDYNMPVMDGLTAIKALRAAPIGRELAILMVTGSTAGADRERAMEAGTDRFFTKPYRRRELLDVITNVLIARGAIPADETLDAQDHQGA